MTNKQLELLNVFLCIAGYFLLIIGFNIGLILTIIGSVFGIILFHKTKMYFQIIACSLYLLMALVGVIKIIMQMI
jgi:hypothetical protein